MEITVTISDLNDTQKELIGLFDKLDIEGKAELLATAYKEILRMKGLYDG